MKTMYPDTSRILCKTMCMCFHIYFRLSKNVQYGFPSFYCTKKVKYSGDSSYSSYMSLATILLILVEERWGIVVKTIVFCVDINWTDNGDFINFVAKSLARIVIVNRMAMHVRP